MSCSKTRRTSSFGVIALSISIAIVVLPFCCGASGVEGPLVEVASFEGGTAYRTADDVYWVLSLSGDWRQMGRQYGGLVREQLQQFHAEITQDITQRRMGYDMQLEIARLMASCFDDDLNELLRGIAETSGLSEDEVLVLNADVSTLSGLALGGEPPSVCSGLAVWGGYTRDGALIFGRNWDIDRDALLPYMKYLSVVVFNSDSGHSFANVHPLGSVYMETGMNDKGLFIELNNGAASDPTYVEGREDTVSVLVSALNRFSSVDEAAKYLSDVPADLSHILQVADERECVSVERATFGARVRRGTPDGVLAAYNSFIPPYPDEWNGRVAEPPSEEDDPRYVNLISLANSERFFGNLDVDSLKELMDIGVRRGGAVHQGTVYQVIAVPSELTLWIRALDYSDWQRVGLSELFVSR